MNKTIIFIVLILAFAFVHPARAISPTPGLSDIISYFRTVITVSPVDTTVPTVVQLRHQDDSREVVVVDDQSGAREPAIVISEGIKTPYRVIRLDENTIVTALSDEYPQTATDFSIDDETIESDGEMVAELSVRYDRPIATSAFNFSLAPNVAMPQFVAIETEGANGRNIVVYKQRVYSQTVNFPKTISQTFIVRFYYTQPLRLSQLSFAENDRGSIQFVRFLAQPNHSYRVYIDPDGSVPYQAQAESGNLYSPTTEVKLISGVSSLNSLYQAPDRDGDGVIDSEDNCPNTKNADQADLNNNNRGDACEDFDGDGVMNAVDNCPDKPNQLQQDADGDGVGDHCDPEESRFVERLPFLPWLGIGVGFGVVILLFKVTMSQNPSQTSPDTSIDSKNRKMP